MSQMLMSEIPGFFDLADSTIAGGQPLTDYALAKISHNAKFGAVRCEVLNDLDGELINFWRVIKHRPAEFSEAASMLLASRTLWTEWSPLKGAGHEIDRAVQFYAVIKLGFGAQRVPSSFGAKNYGRPSIWWPRMLDDARKIVARLRLVWIENLPWQKCLAKFAGAETFFYIDPPYRCGGSKAYLHRFSDSDHEALADALCGPATSRHGGVGRSKWLLSYNDDPFIRSLYSRRGVVIESVSVPYSIARTGRKSAGELLIRNYDLPLGGVVR